MIFQYSSKPEEKIPDNDEEIIASFPIELLHDKKIKESIARTVLNNIVDDQDGVNLLLAGIYIDRDNESIIIDGIGLNDRYIIPIEVLRGKGRMIMKIVVGEGMEETKPPVYWQKVSSFKFVPDSTFSGRIDHLFTKILRSELRRQLYIGTLPYEIVLEVKKLILKHLKERNK